MMVIGIRRIDGILRRAAEIEDQAMYVKTCAEIVKALNAEISVDATTLTRETLYAAFERLNDSGGIRPGEIYTMGWRQR